MEQTIVPQKKNYAGWIIGGLVLVGGAIVVFVVKDKNRLTLWQKWTSKIGDAGDKEIEDIEKPIEVPPVGTSKWVEESTNPFPLKKGMFGGYTKNLQIALGIPADG